MRGAAHERQQNLPTTYGMWLSVASSVLRSVGLRGRADDHLHRLLLLLREELAEQREAAAAGLMCGCGHCGRALRPMLTIRIGSRQMTRLAEQLLHRPSAATGSSKVHARPTAIQISLSGSPVSTFH